MKYSADDILHQTFERAWRGYDTDQVHEFLQGMAREWDFMSSEIIRLQDELEVAGQELRDFRRRERGLLDALNTAREVADELERKAEVRGARIVEEAERKAAEILESAERQQLEMMEDVKALHRQRGRLERELRSVLDSHARLLDELEPLREPAHDDGPTIHRRPRTQPPTRVDDDDIEEAVDVAGHAHDVDDCERETMVGVMPYE